MVMRLGEILVAQGTVRPSAVVYGLLRQSRCRDLRIGELMESFGFASPEDVQSALAEQIRQQVDREGPPG
jgi:hypothetical protein